MSMNLPADEGSFNPCLQLNYCKKLKLFRIVVMRNCNPSHHRKSVGHQQNVNKLELKKSKLSYYKLTKTLQNTGLDKA